MDGSFELPVSYEGVELIFPAELLTTGYTHKIKVTIEGVDILFEPDEERNYRAVTSVDDRDKPVHVSQQLLRAVSDTLHELFG